MSATTHPPLSIITVSLNAAETIEQTLLSVSRQDGTDIQHIVVDGGSTDGTLEILTKYHNAIATLVIGQDRGISDAFNIGLEHATGHYVAFINSDDYLRENVLSSILAFAETQGMPDIIYGDVEYLDENFAYRESPDLNRIWDFMSIFHPSMIVRRSVFREIGGFLTDYRYAMDSEWVHRAASKNYSFVYYPEIISTMRLGGLSHTHLRKSLSEFRRSAISHGARTWRASYYFCRQWTLHSLLKSNTIKNYLLSRREE